MVEVASGEVLLEEVGLAEVIASLNRFSEGVESSMLAATAATEAATQVSKSSIVAYAALGAAIGTVFVDFIRTSSVVTTLGRAFGSIFGAIADIFLVELIPLFRPLIKGLVALMDVLRDLPGPVKAVIAVIALAATAFAILGGPLTVLALAIGAVILVWQNWGAIVEFFRTNILEPFVDSPWGQLLIGAWESVLSFFTTLYEALTTPIQGIEDAWTGFSGFFEGLWAGMGAIFQRFIDTVLTPFIDLFTDPVGTIETAFRGLADFFGDVFGSAIPDAIRGGINAVIGSFEGFANAVIDAWNAAIGAAESGVNAILAAYRVLQFIPGVFVIGIPEDVALGRLESISLPRLQAGGEVLEPGLVYVHPREIVLPAGAGATVGPLPPLMAGGGGRGPTIEYHGPTYNINSPIPTSVADMTAFRRMLDEHSRKEAERLMSKLRRRT